MTNYSFQDWFNRTTGQWVSERSYFFNMETKKPTTMTTSFSIAALTEGEWDYRVIWSGQTEGVMNLRLHGNELHRDIGYFTSSPTVSEMSMVDKDTLVTITTYDGKRFRESVRLLDDDKLRLRQTVGVNEETGKVVIIGSYVEFRSA